MNYALTVYPLSRTFRSRLEQSLSSEPVYLNLAELRRLPVRETLRRLRALDSARLVVPLEDEASLSVLPVLKIVAGMSNASVIDVLHPDLRIERLNRWQLLPGLMSLGAASLATARDAARCTRELSRLMTAARIETKVGDAGTVLYVNANLWFGVKAGGSIGHVAGVINAMCGLGLQPTYASAGGRTMIRSEIPLVALNPPATFGLPLELNHYRFDRMIRRQLRRLPRPSMIYQRMSLGNCSGVALSRQWGVPLVIEYNGSEAWVAKHWGRPLKFHDLAEKCEDACLRHAHVVVTISDVLRDELIERGVAPARIVSYPNCIDPAVFDPARFSADDSRTLRRTLGIPSDAVLLTFVGTFGQWHGADVLATAIRRLVDREPQWLREAKVHFLLVGDGVKMPVVRETLGNKCDEFVTMTGIVPQADAPAYLAASDVFVSPHVANADGSRFFGSPTKLFEYMAMGKAIVASDLDQIGEVLRNCVRAGNLPAADLDTSDSRLAMLFPPGDIDGLIASLKFVAERPASRAVLGGNARSEALSRYTWKHHTAAILDRVTSIAR